MTPREVWSFDRTLLVDDPALGFRLDLSRKGRTPFDAVYSAR